MTLTETRPGVLRLDGVLTMDTVAAAQSALDKALNGGAMTLDLSGISQCDSAAVALLLALRRRKDSHSVKLENIPATLYGLANLYELAPLLGFTREA